MSDFVARDQLKSSVYVCSVPERDPALLRMFVAGMPAADVERGRRYLRHEDQLLHFASRWLLRAALADTTGVRDWTFLRSSTGKPRAAEGHMAIDFSISHAKGLVVVGIASCCRIGVDAESLRQRHDVEGLATSVLAQPERDWLSAQPERVRSLGFLRLWTLKEAILKGEGVGLRCDPRSLCIDLDARALRMDSFETAWSAWSWLESSTHHLVACAVDASGAAAPPELFRVSLPSPTTVVTNQN